MMWESKQENAPDGWRYLWRVTIPGVSVTPVRTLPGVAIKSKINGKAGWDKLPIGMADSSAVDLELQRGFCDTDLRAAIEGEGVDMADEFGVTTSLFVCTTWMLYTDGGNAALDWDEFDRVLFVGVQVFETGDSYSSNGIYKLTLIDGLKVLLDNISPAEFARDFRTFTDYWGGLDVWEYKVKQRVYQVLFNSASNVRHGLVEWAGADRELVIVRWVDVMQHMENYLQTAFDHLTGFTTVVDFRTVMYDAGGEIVATHPNPLRYIQLYEQNLEPDAAPGVALSPDDWRVIGMIRDTSGGAPATDYSDIVGGLLHTSTGWAAEYKSLWDLLSDLTGSGLARGAIYYTISSGTVLNGRIEWRGAWHGNTSADTMPTDDHYKEWEVIRQPNTLGSAKAVTVTPRGQDVSSFEVKNDGRNENAASADMRFPLHNLPSGDTAGNYIAAAQDTSSLDAVLDVDITGTRAIIGRLDPTVENIYYELSSVHNGGESWIDADGENEIIVRVHWDAYPLPCGWANHTDYVRDIPSIPYAEFATSLFTLWIFWQINLTAQQSASWPFVASYYMAKAYGNRKQCDWEVTVKRPNPFAPDRILHTFPIRPSDLEAGIFPHLEAEAVILEADWGDTEDKIRFSIRPETM